MARNAANKGNRITSVPRKSDPNTQVIYDVPGIEVLEGFYPFFRNCAYSIAVPRILTPQINRLRFTIYDGEFSLLFHFMQMHCRTYTRYFPMKVIGKSGLQTESNMVE